MAPEYAGFIPLIMLYCNICLNLISYDLVVSIVEERIIASQNISICKYDKGVSSLIRGEVF